MLPGYSKVQQAFMGTMFTWGLTAAGAALVFVLPRGMSEAKTRWILDVALGFAGTLFGLSVSSGLAPVARTQSANTDTHSTTHTPCRRQPA